MTTRLSDLQLVLLSSAAARPDGNLLPPADSVAGQLARIRRTIPPLIKRALVQEVDVATPEQAWRFDGERSIGVTITDAGRSAIGTDVPVVEAPKPASEPQPDAAAETPKPVTKSALVLALLRREQGATLAELVEATGWLPHTTRAALTGLRKKGHGIAKAKRDEVTCYRVDEAA